MDSAQEKRAALKRAVWRHYRAHGRAELPWRTTRDPYRILVSEIMLQQTQVDRVVPKYRSFIKRFPNPGALAGAPLAEVLKEWQGLGYNRRARALHESAKCITKEYGGRVPRTVDELRTLPGVGPYTAGAVAVFAYNEPVPLVETNIRTVIFHALLDGRHNIRDTEVVELAAILLDKRNPREWHWALMDYGSHLKRQGVRLNAASKHYVKQTVFEGSDRQMRGRVVRALLEGARHADALAMHVGCAPARCRRIVESLERDGLVRVVRGKVSVTPPRVDA